MKKNWQEKGSLKYSMMSVITFGWLLPLAVITLVITVFVYGRLNSQISQTISTTTEKAAEICTLRLQDCVTQSKELSYNTRLASIYSSYQKNQDSLALYSSTTQLLEEKYKFNLDFNMTGLFFSIDKDRVYSTGNQELQTSLRFYKAEAQQQIQEIAETIGTKTVLAEVNGHLYLIRNIMDHAFTPYAVLFMDLNESRVFESLESIWHYDSYAVFADGKELMKVGSTNFNTLTENYTADNAVHLVGQNQVYMSDDVFDQTMLYAVSFNRPAINAELQGPNILLLFLLLIFVIPLIIIVFRFFNRRVSKPIEELSAASGALAEGNYGVKVKVHEGNGEISTLDRNFNDMSDKLKMQFEKIYLEEIALRDANLHAMQSQINPHFLNNTLEIINWESRLGDTQKVSKMIESLSVMMAATTNREQNPLIPLSEEMSYVQAYLYIIQCRYGERFHFEQKVNPEAMSYMVPRLIIQPIIENAVEHGRDKEGKAFVSLQIEGGSAPESALTIIITNSGVPTESDMVKIDELLNAETVETTEASHIGIRNVNRRLKLIYGNDSGLTIESDGMNHTVSTILIKK